MKALSKDEIAEFLEREPAWSFSGGALTREWTFDDFAAAMLFVGQVAAEAEAAGHHPDIDIRYNKVLLALVTHDAGGVTERDSAMAVKLSQL